MSKNVQYVKNTMPPHKEFLAGFGSAILTISATYPVTKLLYRQILENQSARKSFQNLKKEGFFALYRGALSPMIQRCITLSSMFGVYRAATIPLETLEMNEYVEKMCACSLVGALESVFMPLERVQMLLIVATYNKRFKHIFHVAKVIAKDYPLKEFYRGYSIILFRNITSNSFFFITKDELEKRFKFSDIQYRQNTQHFVVGAAVGIAMTVLFYPLKVAKVNIHKELGGKFKSNKEIFTEIYNKDGGGIVNFYRGSVLNGWRALFSWGITNSSYEYIKKKIY